MVMGASGGSKNSKDVGPTGQRSPEPTTRGRELVVRWELVTYSEATEVSYNAVAANLIW